MMIRACPGRLSTSKTDKAIEKFGDLIHQKRQVSICELAEIVYNDKESVWQILHEHVNMRKVCTKAVLKNLTYKQKD